MTISTPSDSDRDEIEKHIAHYIGNIRGTFQDETTNNMPIQVHHVCPTTEKPWHILITSGMSNLPMTTPPGIDCPKYAELMMCLPGDWKMDQESLKDKVWHWPIVWLRYLAKYPHENNTGFAYGHSIPHSYPPEPFSKNTKLCASIFTLPVLVSQEFWQLHVTDRSIVFYCVEPIYQEELNLRIEIGMDELVNRMDRYGITEVVSLNRKNVGLI